ncbi:hypothetical protein HHL11_22185 [Ramlibacter sp. G-1-2-2]|uniref:DUF4124 domain-containing protein n=1 Tax=Ramlibacter agri TaxID=2728837 RepID=A0A848HAM3_9BURK|nr:hypothetical protein [Ramlibacter agri]NML46471.1 hypothetical protein [Ramlibacter agri]
MKSKLALLLGLALIGAKAMACYTVYDSRDRVLYSGADAPVDMRLQLHEGLRARGYPAGARLEFDETSTCQRVTLGALARPTGSDVPPNHMAMERSATRTVARSGPPAPLFTSRETAEASRLPHVQVAGDIVMVPPQAADRAIKPTVTVLPAPTFVAAAPAAPDTTSLGAGPATYGAAAPRGRRQVVITELRDPPVTIVNNGGSVTVTPSR